MGGSASVQATTCSERYMACSAYNVHSGDHSLRPESVSQAQQEGGTAKAANNRQVAG